MSMDQAEGFTDNWAYLKAELQWLDRVLMLAVARQKKEAKDVERVAQSKADRATSHWWKGVVFLEGNVSYDEYRQPLQQAASTPKPSQQQQIEQRIVASRQQGIVLGLPQLCDRLQLTPFEKNLVLMSLAPELNRRYAKLYRVLRTEEMPVKTDLPSLDLVLRLFCRNDLEWRSARNRLTADSPLTQYQLLQLLPNPEETLLSCSLKLEDSVLNYLISDQPTAEALEGLLTQQTLSQQALGAPVASCPSPLTQALTSVDWSDLVLPAPLLASLQYLTQQVKGCAASAKWGVLPQHGLGQVVLLTGQPGTGKTCAAEAIAHALQTPLFSANLANIAPENEGHLLQEIAAQAPTVLLIESAQLWLGRSGRLAAAALHQFLSHRRSLPAITLLSQLPCPVSAPWRSQIDQTLLFPLPSERDRLKLWKRAFPTQVPLSRDVDWKALAQLPLTGDEIGAIAQATLFYAAAIEAPKVEMSHLLYVLSQRGKTLKLKPKPQRRPAKAL
jgi:ATPase family associated with various cellular activities (AAA)